MSLLRPLREAFSASIGDGKRLISQRLSLGLLLALVTLPVAAFVASYTLNLRAVGWIATPGLWVISFLYYADTMRFFFVADYELTVLKVLRLIALLFIWLGLVVLAWFSFAAAIARLQIPPQALYLLRQGAFYVLMIYFGTKLAFAAFALKNRGVFSACGRSWMLTTGSTFWPTLLVMAVFYSLGSLVQAALWAAQAGMKPWAWATLHVAIVYPYAILVGAVIYPLLARWMVQCETLRRDVSPIVPPA